jgi:hypothetical protein
LKAPIHAGSKRSRGFIYEKFLVKDEKLLGKGEIFLVSDEKFLRESTGWPVF